MSVLCSIQSSSRLMWMEVNEAKWTFTHVLFQYLTGEWRPDITTSALTYQPQPTNGGLATSCKQPCNNGRGPVRAEMYPLLCSSVPLHERGRSSVMSRCQDVTCSELIYFGQNFWSNLSVLGVQFWWWWENYNGGKQSLDTSCNLWLTVLYWG